MNTLTDAKYLRRRIEPTEKDLHTCFGHANAAIDDAQGLVNLVRYKPDEHLRLPIQLAFVRKALEPNLVQCLRAA